MRRHSHAADRGADRRKPARLQPGSVIGIAAPASPFDPEVLRRGVGVLEAMGFETVVPEGVFARRRHLAGPDAERAALFQNLWRDERVDAVLCARGGYGCLRILPMLDYDALAAHPKPLIGFSDVTALHAAVGDRCGLVTFHAPLATTLASASERTLESFRTALLSGEPQTFQLADGASPPHSGAAAGPLCGGNLTTLCHLVGTPFMPDLSGGILFLEDRGEAPYRLDRMLTHLKLAGCLDGVRGVVLGSFEGCGTAEEIRAVVEDCLDPGLPVLSGLAAGHTDPNLTLPLGAEAVLDADARTLTVEAGTRAA